MVPYSIFSIFGQPVYLYGLCIAVGLIVCLIVFYFYTKHAGMLTSVQDFCFFVAIAAIALGFFFAKLYQAIYDWIETKTFDFAHAGITAMGGFIGGAAVFILIFFLVGKQVFKKNKMVSLKSEFNTVVRVAPISITVAHGFGRIGCLFGGCCHGTYLGADYVVGGMWMRAADTGVWGYYIPTQLYEALFLFILFAVLSILFFKRSNITMPIYLIAYGVWRIIIEFFRTDARGAIVLGLAPSQWQSIIFIAGGVALLVIYRLLKIPYVLPERKPATEAEDAASSADGEVSDAVMNDKSGNINVENVENPDKNHGDLHNLHDESLNNANSVDKKGDE